MEFDSVDWDIICIKACPYVLMIMFFILLVNILYVCNHYHCFMFNHDSNLVYYHLKDIL